jgi:hypothetical protein
MAKCTPGLLLAFNMIAPGQAAIAQILEVGPNVLVMSPPDWGALAEPHLAAHPDTSGRLIGGVIVADTAGAPSNRAYCALVTSLDGGMSWQSRNSGISNCADPWLAITRSGEAVFLALGRHPAHGQANRMGLLVARSPDGGRTWSDTVLSLGSQHDRPTMVADPRETSPRSVIVFSGNAVKQDDYPARYTVFVSRSVNAGQSFRQPVNVLPSNLNLNSAEGVVLRDGTVLASFVDFMRNVDGFRSREGMLERRRIWMLRSHDDGRSFSPPLFVTEHCGQSSYDVAADLSDGPHSGRIYLACRMYGGTGVALHHSDDRGETWSAPRLVPGSETGGIYQPRPRLAVNRSGTVGIAWLHAPDDPSGACFRVVAAASSDGGETFSTVTPVSPRSCPDPTRNGFVHRRWSMGGDYFGWTASADGVFHALWADARRGPFEMWTAKVTVQSQ